MVGPARAVSRKTPIYFIVFKLSHAIKKGEKMKKERKMKKVKNSQQR